MLCCLCMTLNHHSWEPKVEVILNITYIDVGTEATACAQCRYDTITGSPILTTVLYFLEYKPGVMVYILIESDRYALSAHH